MTMQPVMRRANARMAASAFRHARSRRGAVLPLQAQGLAPMVGGLNGYCGVLILQSWWPPLGVIVCSVLRLLPAVVHMWRWRRTAGALRKRGKTASARQIRALGCITQKP